MFLILTSISYTQLSIQIIEYNLIGSMGIQKFATLSKLTEYYINEKNDDVFNMVKDSTE